MVVNGASGTGRVGICTDSTSQLPPDLAQRYGIEIVPVTVVADGEEYLDGVDLDADSFYERFTAGHRPTVSLTQPSAGQFAAAYEDLAGRGCTQILSIHSSRAEGMLSAARLAVRGSSIPVRLVDSGADRFGVSCCAWAAAEAVANRASADVAVGLAESLARRIGNVFISGVLEGPEPGGHAMREIDVRSLRHGKIELVHRASSITEAVNVMAAFALAWSERLHIAVGTAHRDCAPVAEALAHALGEAAAVDEVVHFRIGPSIGQDVGPGTVGCVMFPSSPSSSPSSSPLSRPC